MKCRSRHLPDPVVVVEAIGNVRTDFQDLTMLIRKRPGVSPLPKDYYP